MIDKIDIHDLEHIRKQGYRPLGWVPCPRGKNGKINPQVTQVFVGGNTFVSVFHVKPVYYETIIGTWRPLSEVTSYHGNRKIVFTMDGFRQVHPRYIDWLIKRAKLIKGQVSVDGIQVSPYVQYLHDLVTIPKLGLTTTTVYPDPHPETTTVDGSAVEGTSTATWSTLVGDAGDGAIDNGSLDGRLYAFWAHASVYEDLYRTFVLYDTSSITDTDTIDATTLTVTNAEKTDPGSKTPNTDVFTATPASNTSIVASDYTQTGSTSQTGSATAYSSIPNGGTVTFTFDSTGRGNVSKTGVSKFSIKNSNYDNANSAPGTTAGDWDTYSRMYTAEDTGTSRDPVLTVTSSAGVTFIPRVSFIM